MKQVVLLLTIINMMMTTMNMTVWWRWWCIVKDGEELDICELGELVSK